MWLLIERYLWLEYILIVHHWIRLLLTRHVLRHSSKCIELSWLRLWDLAILIDIDSHVHASKHICLLTASHRLIPLWHHAHKGTASWSLSLHLMSLIRAESCKWIEHLLRLLLLLLEVLLLIVLSRKSVKCRILSTLSQLIGKLSRLLQLVELRVLIVKVHQILYIYTVIDRLLLLCLLEVVKIVISRFQRISILEIRKISLKQGRLLLGSNSRCIQVD